MRYRRRQVRQINAQNILKNNRALVGSKDIFAALKSSSFYFQYVLIQGAALDEKLQPPLFSGVMTHSIFQK